MLNFHWLLEREAVADERSGSLDADTLGYSSSWGGHWPLTWVGSRSGMLNSYWPSTHPGSLGRLSRALNSDWLSGSSFFSSFSGTSWLWRGERSSWRCTGNGGCSGTIKVHNGAARCRRRGVVNPIHAAFIQGLGYITPSQDHTPSLACKTIVETAGGSTEVSVRGQEPPQCGSHGVAQALTTAGGDLSSKRKAF